MNRDELRTGCIQKIVRVPLVALSRGEKPDTRDFQGYGILRDANGQDVFFVGSAVMEGGFAKLETGVEVTYIMEPGPLARASHVCVAAKASQTRKSDQEFTIN